MLGVRRYLSVLLPHQPFQLLEVGVLTLRAQLAHDFAQHVKVFLARDLP